ncbi:MAG: HD domain-containing protein [Bacteroidia bacterium]
MKDQLELPLPGWLTTEMAATQQNPRYHREGSVLAHTQYVLQQYFALRDQFDLTDEERDILYWTAVLHDIGKIRATVWQDNRWRSPGHERAGVPMALNILLDRSEVPAAMRNRILDLIRWHGYPLRFSQWQQPISDLKLLGTRVDLRLLGIFGLMDFHGRDCDDKVDVLARMDEFNKVSVPKAEYELGRFKDLQAAHQGWNLRHKNAAWNAIQLKDARLLEKLISASLTDEIVTRGQRITFVTGLPFAGKSTWISKNLPEAFHIQLAEHEITNALGDNDFLLERKMVEFRHLLRVYLNRHQHVVMETRPIKEQVRLELLTAFKDMQVTIDYVVVEATFDTIRSGAEHEQLWSNEALERLLVDQDILHPWEAHRIQYVQS